MDEYIKRQIDLHEKIADHYDRRYRYAYSLLFQEYWNDNIVALVPPHMGRGQRALELGCGTGIFLGQLVKVFDAVVGLDLSVDMLSRIKERDPRFRGAAAGDGMKMPFRDHCFDCIVCRGVLHHFPDLGCALEEIGRVLEADGVLVFSEPSNDSPIVRRVRRRMYKKSDRFDEEDRAFLTRELKPALEAAGYRVAKIKRFGFLSYIFAGFPDHFSLLARVPGNRVITRVLILLDRLLSHIPLVNRQSLHIIVQAKKIDAGPNGEGPLPGK